MSKIIGIDYGQKKIGFAITDFSGQIVFEKGVLMNSNIENVVDYISKILDGDQLHKIVIGKPYSKSGEETDQTKRMDQFATKLKKYFPGIDIVFVDESFTSFEAQNKIDEISKNVSTLKSSEDEMAAALILQRYVDFQQ
ncbi:Holliday junction resolvase RuvX [Candidatus Peregrinibacteria bacterium]|nr:Holliday junction resolvase RuvX [Candidatus Peregrinibacteria bacterium]